MDDELKLLEKCKKKDETAYLKLKTLYRRYSNILASKYHSCYSYSGITYDDLMSCCLNSIYTAINNFNINRSRNFHSYWEKIAINEIRKLYRFESYYGGARYFMGLSLDQTIRDGDVEYSEIIGLEEPFIIDNKMDKIKDLILDVELRLSVKEKQLLLLILDGRDRTTTMQIIGMQESTYYHCYSSGVEKVRKFLIRKDIYE